MSFITDTENALLRILSPAYGVIQPLFNTFLVANPQALQHIPTTSIIQNAIQPKTALQNFPTSVTTAVNDVGTAIKGVGSIAGDVVGSVLQPLTLPLIVVGAVAVLYLLKK